MDADKEGLLLTQATSWVARYQEAARAVREEASEPAVHGYRIAARRLLALLALWRPLTYHPELEQRLLRSVGRLSALRDAQVYAERFGKPPASTGNTHKSACRVPLLSRRLARWLAAVAQVPDARALAFSISSIWPCALMRHRALSMNLFPALGNLPAPVSNSCAAGIGCASRSSRPVMAWNCCWIWGVGIPAG